MVQQEIPSKLLTGIASRVRTSGLRLASLSLQGVDDSKIAGVMWTPESFVGQGTSLNPDIGIGADVRCEVPVRELVARSPHRESQVLLAEDPAASPGDPFLSELGLPHVVCGASVIYWAMLDDVATMTQVVTRGQGWILFAVSVDLSEALRAELDNGVLSPSTLEAACRSSKWMISDLFDGETYALLRLRQ